MKRARLFLLALLTACTGLSETGTNTEPVTELTMNVRVEPTGVRLFAREAARPCRCTAGEWIERNECGTSSDGVTCSCTPRPASCIETFRLEREGTIIAQDVYDADFGGGESLGMSGILRSEGVVLVVDGCGGTAEIPINIPTVVPIPTIRSLTADEQSLYVGWDAEPAADSVYVSTSDGFGADICHRPGGVSGQVAFPTRIEEAGAEIIVGVIAAAKPVSIETDLGTATIWIGGKDWQVMSSPN